MLHIVQPRSGGISTWETAVADAVRWAEDVVAPAAAKAYAGAGELVPGKHCKFCPIEATCRARMKQAQAVAALPGYRKTPTELTEAEIGEALRLGEGVVDWLSKLKDHAAHAIAEGKAIPGYKLVAGRTSRSWVDQLRAFETLKAAGLEEALLYERQPLTPPALEKKLGKKQFEDVGAAALVKTSPGAPTLVHEEDKRKAWSPAAADFADKIKK